MTFPLCLLCFPHLGSHLYSAVNEGSYQPSSLDSYLAYHLRLIWFILCGVYVYGNPLFWSACISYALVIVTFWLNLDYLFCLVGYVVMCCNIAVMFLVKLASFSQLNENHFVGINHKNIPMVI